MPMTLALDIATRTGWCHDGASPDAPPVSGIFQMASVQKAEGGGTDYGRTFAGFAVKLREKLAEIRPAVLAAEAPLHMIGQGSKAEKFMTNQSTVRILYGFAAIAEAEAFLHGAEFFEAQARMIKHYFVGSAKASKDDMIRRCRLLGWPVEDHNQADAIALWAMTKSVLDPSFAPRATSLFGRGRSP
jgi:Holliday junction resolvasome RuvABC endonuclease subunit